MLVRIACAKLSGLTHYYRKVGTRKAQAISKVCFAAVGRVEQNVIVDTRIVVGSVAPIVLRCIQTENALRGRPINDQTIEQSGATLLQEISPIDDIRSTANYRLQVAKNLLVDFLTTLRA